MIEREALQLEKTPVRATDEVDPRHGVVSGLDVGRLIAEMMVSTCTVGGEQAWA